MLFVYTTYRDAESANALSRKLIDQKLAVGVNYWPVHSMMGLKGECREAEGVAVLIRTFETKLPQVEDLISSDFPDGIPVVATFAVWRINRPYKEWLMKQGFE